MSEKKLLRDVLGQDGEIYLHQTKNSVLISYLTRYNYNIEHITSEIKRELQRFSHQCSLYKEALKYLKPLRKYQDSYVSSEIKKLLGKEGILAIYRSGDWHLSQAIEDKIFPSTTCHVNSLIDTCEDFLEDSGKKIYFYKKVLRIIEGLNKKESK